MSKSVADTFERAMRDIFDNDEFVFCACVVAKTEENMNTVLDFIGKSDEVGDVVTHDDIVSLISILRDRTDSVGL